MEFYLHFSLDMDRSLGFGSIAYDYLALFRLALASAPFLKNLTLPHTITRRTILQKVPDHTLIVVLSVLGSTGFQVLFTPLPGFFSPFLHSTVSLSVIK